MFLWTALCEWFCPCAIGLRLLFKACFSTSCTILNSTKQLKFKDLNFTDFFSLMLYIMIYQYSGSISIVFAPSLRLPGILLCYFQSSLSHEFSIPESTVGCSRNGKARHLFPTKRTEISRNQTLDPTQQKEYFLTETLVFPL